MSAVAALNSICPLFVISSTIMRVLLSLTCSDVLSVLSAMTFEYCLYILCVICGEEGRISCV